MKISPITSGFILLFILCIALGNCPKPSGASEPKKYQAVVKFETPVQEVELVLLDTGKGKHLQICSGNSCQRVVLRPVSEEK